MDMIRIQRIQEQARAEDWSFIRQCDALNRCGVSRIRMKLASGEIEYTDDAGVTLIVSPLEPVFRECTESLDVPAIDSARERYLRKEIELQGLFDLLAVAGVWFYELETGSKTVRHFDWKGQLFDDGFISAGPSSSGSGDPGSRPDRVPAGSLLVRTYSPDDSE